MIDDIKPSPASNHDHKFFLFETRQAFEPFQFETNIQHTPQLYQRIEYAVLSCNCGEVIKRKVKSEEA